MLGYLFSTKAIIMKEKAKVQKDDFDIAEDDNIDNSGYRDIPTIGVSAPPPLWNIQYKCIGIL